MRINIAPKVFLGFLLIVSLNIFFFLIVYKLSDLNTIAHILKNQDMVQQSLIRIANLHENRVRQRTIFGRLKRQDSIEKFEHQSAIIENLIDSVSTHLDSVRRLDSLVTRSDSSSGELTSLISAVTDTLRVLDRQYVFGFRSYARADSGMRIADVPTQRRLALLSETIGNADTNFVLLLERLNRNIDSQTKLRIKDIESRIDNAKQITVFLLVGISLFAAVFAFVFSRAITNSLRRLKESASYIGKGNFYFNPSGYPQDEIGDLASAFFDMAIDLKQTQEELVRSKRLAAIGEVVASVNHEINNPLMIISGNAQFLEMSLSGYPEEIKERVRIILEETERISQVTRKLREIRNPIVEDYTSSGEQMINLDKSSRDRADS